VRRNTRIAIAVVVVAACGDNRVAFDAATPDAYVACSPSDGTTVAAREIAAIADLPTLVTSPPGDPRLFVVGRAGAIRIVDGGVLIERPFLDLSFDAGGPVHVDFNGERGLLGLAFHPSYAQNGRFFVFYTTLTTNEIVEYHVDPNDPGVAVPASARPLISIVDPAGNHNGGMLAFGPDGYLYISTGDGGGHTDPFENGQNTQVLLGKILRIDVDGGLPYAIPDDNPFVVGGGAPEIWAYGTRNPWRMSFDPATGDLYVGDVGEDTIEEIDVLPVGSAGADLGWDDCEGSRDFEGTGCAAPAMPRRLPVLERERTATGWCSVIGGAVYRGACYPALAGRYFTTDHCAGGLLSFIYRDGVATDVVEHAGTFATYPTSLSAAADGELYLTEYTGRVFHLEVE
jgi:glucose/arabinose dehydrogenase